MTCRLGLLALVLVAPTVASAASEGAGSGARRERVYCYGPGANARFVHRGQKCGLRPSPQPQRKKKQ